VLAIVQGVVQRSGKRNMTTHHGLITATAVLNILMIVQHAKAFSSGLMNEQQLSVDVQCLAITTSRVHVAHA
jgi:hypothetical protein